MHKYIVDKVAPNWLKFGRSIIILQEEGASIIKYIIFILLVRSFSPKALFSVTHPFTSTYSIENPTREPLKGFRYSRSW